MSPRQVQQPIGDEDVVAFQLRRQPAGETGRDDKAGPVAVDQSLGRPAGVFRPGPERISTTRRPWSPPSRRREPLPRIVTAPWSRSSKQPASIPSANTTPRWQGFGSSAGGGAGCGLSLRRLNHGLADLGLRRVLEPILQKRAENHRRFIVTLGKPASQRENAPADRGCGGRTPLMAPRGRSRGAFGRHSFPDNQSCRLATNQ